MESNKKALDHDSDELRQRAEAYLQERLNATTSAPPEDLQRLVHELSVHQIELEMQKDELLHSMEFLEHALDRFVALYDFAPLGYLTLHRDGRIVEANLMASKMLGVDRFSLQGDRFIRFVALKDSRVFNALLDRVFSHQEPRSADLTLQRDWKDVSAVSLVHLEATISQNGQECWLTMFDITDQVKITQENARLQASKKEWETTISTLFADFPDPILLLDRHYSILALNQALANILGKTAQECLNSKGFDLLPPTLREGHMKIIEQVLATAKPVIWEDDQNGKNFHHTICPITDKAGEITQFLVIVQNVTTAK